jgi:hypothetical protein
LFSLEEPAKIAGCAKWRSLLGVGGASSKIAIFAKIDIEGRVSESPRGGVMLNFQALAFGLGISSLSA